MNNQPRPIAGPAYVFDAYGTLFDVHSAVARYRDGMVIPTKPPGYNGIVPPGIPE